MTNRAKIIGILTQAASDGYNLNSRIETERLADLLISHGQAVGEGGYRKETFDRLVDAMAKEVEGWKKHFESLYETAKATLRAEVAKEIFTELKTVMIDEWRYPIIAELKKKYLEGEV